VALRDIPRLGLAWPGFVNLSGRHVPRPSWSWANDFSMLCMAGAISLIVFRIAQPYAFAGPNFWDMALNQQWWDDIQRERDFQQGNADFPPFIQFADGTPFLTPLKNLVIWGTGPALGLFSIAASVVAAVFMFRRRDVSMLLPLLMLATVFVFWGPRFVAFMRYFAPMYPLLALFAAWGLFSLWRWARSDGRLHPRLQRWRGIRRFEPRTRLAAGLAITAFAVVVGATGWWAMAFQSVYSQEHPRIAATRWFYENVPASSGVTSEVWDDRVPWRFPAEGAREYRPVELEPYETDSIEKVQKLVYGIPGDNVRTGLASADYVAVTSNRIRESVKKLEREYPATIRYYELLETGELGFERVATFRVQPTFLGISINDQGAEESFTVF
jgi:hypothetical protein